MDAPLLEKIVEQEGTAFQQISNKWRPQNLFFDLQTRALIQDMTSRYRQLHDAEAELKLLPRADMYLKNVRLMKFILRRAYFVRRSNHLAFAEAISEFYTAFGTVLRYLKIDQARGQLEPDHVK